MQHHTFVIGLLAGLLGGVIAGGAISGLRSPQEPAPTSQELEPALEIPDTTALEGALQEAMRQNVDLDMRLAALEGRTPESSRTPVDGFVPRDEYDAFEREVRTWMSQAPGGLAASDPDRFRLEVHSAIQAIRAEERSKNAIDRIADREVALEKELAGMRDWLELDAMQLRTMRSVLRARNDRNEELSRLWKVTGADTQALSATKTENNERFQSELQAVLTPNQFTTYSSARNRRPK